MQSVQNINNIVSVQVPDEFICPISQDIMSDPVIDTDGISYDKQFIVNWIRSNGGSARSPMNSNKQIKESDLIQNRGLKAQIELFKQQNLVYHVGQQNLQTQSAPNVAQQNLNIDIKIKQNNDNLFFELFPTSQTIRTPVHIVCVVDISGSMFTGVSIKSSSGTNEDNGLSRLDIVKHAINTIVKTLDQNDYITIITFSNQGNVIIEEKQTTTNNKQLILNEVKKFIPDGGTNLWDGIKCAIEVINKSQLTNHLNSIFLLTDGQPSVEPPRGHEYMIETSLKNLGPKCIINTFGFSYELNSLLLSNIAKIGNGFYSFIPDAGFVGTIFINALSNLLMTCASHCSITVKYDDDTLEYLNLDLLKYELIRTEVIKKTIDKNISTIEIKYINPITNQIIVNTFNIDNIEQTELTNSMMEIIVKNKFCKLLSLFNSSNDLQSNLLKLNEFITEVNLINTTHHTHLINGILQDAQGQVTEGLSTKENFTKWGCHYFRSLEMAHSKQMCNNFKDPGVQCYSTPEFEIYRTLIDNIFGKIPPPKPSRNISHLHNFSSNTVNTMSSYNTADAGCFAGECSVVTLNGLKKIKNILVGDFVSTGNKKKPFAKVKNVIRIYLEKNPVSMTYFKTGLLLTKWHPVLIHATNNSIDEKICDDDLFEWMFPANLTINCVNSQIDIMRNFCKNVFYMGDYMYDFILEDIHTIEVNGIACVTLGHNFVDDVVRHEYLGSDKVVDDINKLSINGYVNITQKYFTRDETTKQINGIKKPKTIKRKRIVSNNEN